MTEQAFISSAAQKDAFNDLDVEEFEIVATLDSHTSDICREMDGKHFHMKDFQPGVTAPPFHVWCRSTGDAQAISGYYIFALRLQPIIYGTSTGTHSQKPY